MWRGACYSEGWGGTSLEAHDLYVFSAGGRERAVLVHGKQIADVGEASEVMRRAAGARTVRLRGELRPAALDGHLHLVEYGLSLGEADLSGCDAEEARKRLLAKPRRGGWLLGHGAAVAVLRELSRDTDFLRRASPMRVWAHDFHTALTDPGTARDIGLPEDGDPQGGRIERGAGGRPTGLLYETAASPLREATTPDGPERVRAARTAMERLLRLGIVGAVTFEEAEGQEAVSIAAQDIPFRSFVFRMRSGLGPDEMPKSLGPRVELVGVKEFLDGTLGSRTAWMRRPYADHPGTGEPRFAPGELLSSLREFAGRGFAVSLHAIGDSAAEEALNLLELLPRVPAPHRIEHLQIVPHGFEGRLAAAGIAASVQPCHLWLDAAEAKAAWADRLDESYPYERLLQAGAIVAFGSDAPIERPDLDLGIRAAMAAGQLLGDGRKGTPPDVAYRCYTEGVYRSLGRTGGEAVRGQAANLALYGGPPEARALPTLVLSEGRVVYEELAAYLA